MWWQSKEFSANPEADRLSRASRGWVLVLAILLVPPLVWLVFWLLDVLGIWPPFHVIIIPG